MMDILKKLVIFFLVLFQVQIGFANEVKIKIDESKIANANKNITQILESERARDKITGITFSVFTKDSNLLLGQVGSSSANTLENQAKLEADKSIFRIASISKLFNTLAISKLIEQKVFDRNSTLMSLNNVKVVYYLKKHETQERLAQWKKIKIWQLMSHQSGITKDVPNSLLAFNTESLKYHSYPTMDLFYKNLTNIEFLFEPGEIDTGIKYSNMGMNILARVVEDTNLEHLPFDVYIRKNIFKPLQMFTTFYDVPSAQRNNMVVGYGVLQANGRRTEVPKTFYPGAYQGAMGIASTVKDLSHFGSELLKIAYGESKILTNKDVILDWFKVKSPVDPSTAWASGPEWEVMPGDSVQDEIWVGHTGTGASERAILTTNLERNLGVALMFNCTDAQREKYVQLIIKQLKIDLPELFQEKLKLNSLTSSIVSSARQVVSQIKPPVFNTPEAYPAGLDLAPFVGKYYADIAGVQPVTIDANSGHLVFMGQKLVFEKNGESAFFRFPKIPGSPGINSNREPVVFHFNADGTVSYIKVFNTAIYRKLNE